MAGRHGRWVDTFFGAGDHLVRFMFGRAGHLKLFEAKSWSFETKNWSFSLPSSNTFKVEPAGTFFVFFAWGDVHSVPTIRQARENNQQNVFPTAPMERTQLCKASPDDLPQCYGKNTTTPTQWITLRFFWMIVDTPFQRKIWKLWIHLPWFGARFDPISPKSHPNRGPKTSLLRVRPTAFLFASFRRRDPMRS